MELSDSSDDSDDEFINSIRKQVSEEAQRAVAASTMSRDLDLQPYDSHDGDGMIASEVAASAAVQSGEPNEVGEAIAVPDGGPLADSRSQEEDEEEQADDNLNETDYGVVAGIYKILGNQREQVTRELARFEDSLRIPPSLKVDLRPHYRQGLLWMRVHEDLSGGGVLADDQGLGKTITCIATMLANTPQAYRARYESHVIPRGCQDAVSCFLDDYERPSMVPARYNPLAFARTTSLQAAVRNRGVRMMGDEDDLDLDYKGVSGSNGQGAEGPGASSSSSSSSSSASASASASAPAPASSKAQGNGSAKAGFIELSDSEGGSDSDSDDNGAKKNAAQADPPQPEPEPQPNGVPATGAGAGAGAEAPADLFRREREIKQNHKYFNFCHHSHQVAGHQMRFREQGESSKTLIVVPLSVLHQWVHEIGSRIGRRHALRVHVYHGDGTRDLAGFEKADVVITTYGTLANEVGRPFREGDLRHRPIWPYVDRAMSELKDHDMCEGKMSVLQESWNQAELKVLRRAERYQKARGRSAPDEDEDEDEDEEEDDAMGSPRRRGRKAGALSHAQLGFSSPLSQSSHSAPDAFGQEIDDDEPVDAADFVAVKASDRLITAKGKGGRMMTAIQRDEMKETDAALASGEAAPCKSLSPELFAYASLCVAGKTSRKGEQLTIKNRPVPTLAVVSAQAEYTEHVRAHVAQAQVRLLRQWAYQQDTMAASAGPAGKSDKKRQKGSGRRAATGSSEWDETTGKWREVVSAVQLARDDDAVLDEDWEEAPPVFAGPLEERGRRARGSLSQLPDELADPHSRYFVRVSKLSKVNFFRLSKAVGMDPSNGLPTPLLCREADVDHRDAELCYRIHESGMIGIERSLQHMTSRQMQDFRRNFMNGSRSLALTPQQRAAARAREKAQFAAAAASGQATGGLQGDAAGGVDSGDEDGSDEENEGPRAKRARTEGGAAKRVKRKKGVPDLPASASRPRPLLSTVWFRIVLDEGHKVKNPRTKGFHAASLLKSSRRWVLTGTPVHNTFDDVQSLLAFCFIEPVCFHNVWLDLVSQIDNDVLKSLESKDGKMPLATDKQRQVLMAIKQLQETLSSHVLRRVKSDRTGVMEQALVAMPPKRETLLCHPLSEEEMAAYKEIEKREQTELDKVLKASNSHAAQWVNVLVTLLRLRMFCCHPALFHDSQLLQVVRRQKQRKAQARLQRQKQRERRMLSGTRHGGTAAFTVGSRRFRAPRLAGAMEDGEEDEDNLDGFIVDDDEDVDDEDAGWANAADILDSPQRRKKKNRAAVESDSDEDEVEDVSSGGWSSTRSRKKSGKSALSMVAGPGAGAAGGGDADEDAGGVDEVGDGDEREVAAELAAGNDDVANEAAAARLQDKVMDFAGSNVSAQLARLLKDIRKKRLDMPRDELQKLLNGPLLKALDMVELKGAGRSVLKMRPMMTYGASGEVEVPFHSSKMRAVLAQLARVREEDPSSRVIIFTQFVSFMDIIEPAIRKMGVRLCRLDGSMSEEVRKDQIHKFQTRPEFGVFLISLMAGGLGLNLTEANHVFLVDQWWSPSLEHQAIDRCHRLGQPRPCQVWRFVAFNTVEERMQSLKTTKMALSTAAFSDAPPVSVKLGLGDLMRVVLDKRNRKADDDTTMLGVSKVNKAAIAAALGQDGPAAGGAAAGAAGAAGADTGDGAGAAAAANVGASAGHSALAQARAMPEGVMVPGDPDSWTAQHGLLRPMLDAARNPVFSEIKQDLETSVAGLRSALSNTDPSLKILAKSPQHLEGIIIQTFQAVYQHQRQAAVPMHLIGQLHGLATQCVSNIGYELKAHIEAAVQAREEAIQSAQQQIAEEQGLAGDESPGEDDPFGDPDSDAPLTAGMKRKRSDKSKSGSQTGGGGSGKPLVTVEDASTQFYTTDGLFAGSTLQLAHIPSLQNLCSRRIARMGEALYGSETVDGVQAQVSRFRPFSVGAILDAGGCADGEGLLGSSSAAASSAMEADGEGSDAFGEGGAPRRAVDFASAAEGEEIASTRVRVGDSHQQVADKTAAVLMREQGLLSTGNAMNFWVMDSAETLQVGGRAAQMVQTRTLADTLQRCTGIKKLRLTGLRCDVIEAIRTSKTGGLTELVLEQCSHEVDDKVAAELARTQRLLRRLSVAGAFKLQDVRPLLQLPLLEELSLADCTEVRGQALLDDLFERRLAAAETLKKLNLSGCDLLDPPLPLYFAKHCPLLESISLRGFKFAAHPEHGLRQIVSGCFAEQLIELDVSACEIKPRAFKHIVEGCLSLRRLRAEQMPLLTADDLGRALEFVGNLESLQVSNPSASGITQHDQDESLAKLIRGSEDSLVDLSVHGWHGLSDKAIETCVLQLTKLQQLDVSWVPQCSALSLRMLMQGCPSLARLRAVCAGRLDETEVANLRREFPGCDLEH